MKMKASRKCSGYHRILLAGCFFISFSACTEWKRNNKGSDPSENTGVIARVYDKELTYDQITNLVPPGVSRADSIRVVRNYVDNWIRQQVVLRKAEDNLNEEEKDVNKQLEEYRNSLITYLYESQLIGQQVDTLVSDADIEKYYAENESNFRLRNNIVQVNYFRLPANAPKLTKVRDWYRSTLPRDRKLLEEYCFQFATDYYFNDHDWISFEELKKKIPIETLNQEQFLRNNRYVELPDSTHISFLIIKGFKIKESLSPLSFEKDNIRNLIIHKRKLQLIADMEKAAMDQAVKANEVEIFMNKQK